MYRLSSESWCMVILTLTAWRGPSHWSTMWIKARGEESDQDIHDLSYQSRVHSLIDNQNGILLWVQADSLLKSSWFSDDSNNVGMNGLGRVNQSRCQKCEENQTSGGKRHQERKANNWILTYSVYSVDSCLLCPFERNWRTTIPVEINFVVLFDDCLFELRAKKELMGCMILCIDHWLGILTSHRAWRIKFATIIESQ